MSKNTHAFNAEIKQLLDIVIRSLYSNREIFLRELISNASDALDKLKFQSITQPELVKENHEYKIVLQPNKESKTLRILDFGIGMSQDEVQKFIGTIAKSGTKDFVQLNQELSHRPDLIGQFGVGFYSAFMVADRVSLLTQKAGEMQATLWESSGDGSYTLESSVRPEGPGTTITLYLKDFEQEEKVPDFTDPWILKSLVKKYSDFISWPIQMKGEKPDEIETLNSQKALWLKSPQEVSETEHKEFYQHISHDFSAPAKVIHYKAEGTMEFASLMYIPEKKPWDYNTKDYEYGLSLYIKRVFIMSHCKDLLPPYLRFVKGLVDSSDLSLNVSREILQQDRQVHQIAKNVVNKVISTLKEMMTKDRTKYESFWSEFGATLKEGIPFDFSQREKLSDLLLFRSSASEAWTSLEEYLGRIKPEQKDIYYITGERIEAVRNSPYMEKLKAKGYEVLFLIDPIDEWVVQHLIEYKGKKLISIMQEGLELDTEEEKKTKQEEKAKQTEQMKPLLESMKLHLADFVSDVVISDRLTETPVCLVSAKDGMSAHMEKILAQLGKDAGKSKRILEINAVHPVIQNLQNLSEDKKKNWSEILYNQALLTEGSPLPDPVRFSKLVADLMI